MRKFWSNLAVQLGKRAGMVAAIGLLITGILGFGITKLEFATGQDSYLNSSDQVAKDNVAYQDLFGGQIMIVLLTMDEGHTVDELASPENRAVLEAAKAELEENPHVLTVVSPIDALQFSQNLLLRSPDDPSADMETFDLTTATQSIASQAVNWATASDQASGPAAVREEDFGITVERLLPFADEPGAPNEGRTLDNPE